MKTARAILITFLLATTVSAVAAAPAGAQAVPTPTVSVASGPTTSTTFRHECSDALVSVATATSLVFTRTGNLAAPLTAAYTVGGDAVPGEQYATLPGAVTFAAGAATATVTISPVPGSTRNLVSVGVRVTDGASYDVGAPPSATVTFVQPKDPAARPEDCGIHFDANPVERTVPVGGTIAPIQVYEIEGADGAIDPSAVVARLTSGSLPPGVTLLTSGAFSGTPTTAGTSTGHIEVCRARSAAVCADVDLVITVARSGAATTTTAKSTAGTIPITGSTTRTTGLTGGVILGFGLVALGVALRRRTDLTQP